MNTGSVGDLAIRTGMHEKASKIGSFWQRIGSRNHTLKPRFRPSRAAALRRLLFLPKPLL